jgi:hypothetical protein
MPWKKLNDTANFGGWQRIGAVKVFQDPEKFSGSGASGLKL